MNITPSAVGAISNAKVADEEATNDKAAPAAVQAGEKAAAKRRTWKKPKDKPKRPLSSYNIFFQHTRSRIVAGHTEEATPEETIRSIEAILSKNPEKRRHRKTHGRISFGDLARTIADKWKTLEPKNKTIFDHYAEIDMLRYRREVKVWKEKKEREEDEKATLTVQQKQAAFLKSMNSSASSLDSSQSSAHDFLDKLPFEGSHHSDRTQPRKTGSMYDSFNSSYSSVDSCDSELSFDRSATMRMPMLMEQQQQLHQQQQHLQQQQHILQQNQQQQQFAQQSQQYFQPQQQQQLQLHNQQQFLLQQNQQQLQQQQFQQNQQFLQQQQIQQQRPFQQQGFQQQLQTLNELPQPQFMASNQSLDLMGASMSFSNLMGNSSVVSLQSVDPLLGQPSSSSSLPYHPQQQQFGSAHTSQSGHTSGSTQSSGYASSQGSGLSSSHNSGFISSHSSLGQSSNLQASGQSLGLHASGQSMTGLNASSQSLGLQQQSVGFVPPSSGGAGLEGMPPQRAAFFDLSQQQHQDDIGGIGSGARGGAGFNTSNNMMANRGNNNNNNNSNNNAALGNDSLNSGSARGLENFMGNMELGPGRGM